MGGPEPCQQQAAVCSSCPSWSRSVTACQLSLPQYSQLKCSLLNLLHCPLGHLVKLQSLEIQRRGSIQAFDRTACNCHLRRPCAAHLCELDKDNFSPSHISSCARSASLRQYGPNSTAAVSGQSCCCCTISCCADTAAETVAHQYSSSFSPSTSQSSQSDC